MNITNFTHNKIAYVEIDKNWKRAETKILSFAVAASAIPRSRRFATVIYEIVSTQFSIITEYSLRVNFWQWDEHEKLNQNPNRIFCTR